MTSSGSSKTSCSRLFMRLKTNSSTAAARARILTGQTARALARMGLVLNDRLSFSAELEQAREALAQLLDVDVVKEVRVVGDRDRPGLLGYDDHHGVGLLGEAQRRAVARAEAL